jgi:hypothetical protein
MSVTYFIFKTLRYFTLLGAIIFLFLKYYQLPDPVIVYFNSDTSPGGFLPKSQFFYLYLSLLIIPNIILSICYEFIKGFFKKNFNLKVPNQALTFAKYNSFFENWINLILLLLNFSLMAAIMILGKLNSTEYPVTIANYSWFPLFLALLVIVGIAYPIVFFLLKKETKR